MSTRAALATTVLGLGTALLVGCGRPPPATAPASAATPAAVRYVSHLAAGGILPAGATPSNPHAGDAAVAKSGAQLFITMNCDGCHGGDAAGMVGPNLGDGRWRYGGSDAEVFSSIYYGRPKGMPAFGGALGSEGVWTLVTYLRSLAKPDDLPTETFEEK